MKPHRLKAGGPRRSRSKMSESSEPLSSKNILKSSPKTRRRRSSYEEAVAQKDAKAWKAFACALGFFACAFCFKLLWYQVLDSGRLTTMAEARSVNDVTLFARRGTIYDRNGNVLAASENCSTLYCNPTEITKEGQVASALARHLGGVASDYHEALSADTTFSYIAKRQDSAKADALLEELREEGLGGVYELPDVRRVYPYGDVAGQVLGLVGDDGHGLTGLELYYDDVLAGKNGRRVMEVGLGGTPVAGGAYHEESASDGVDIVISLDVEIQAACEKILVDMPKTYGAKNANACVMDPRTGEIYALASTPFFPAGDAERATNEALSVSLVSQVFEPGSVSKAFTAAIGLETGAFSAETVWNVPPQLKSGISWVTDDDKRVSFMDMDPAEILRRSSNTGAMLEAQAIGGKSLLQGLKSFGIGSPTGIDFPGEANGILHERSEWDDATLNSMAFGQGYSATPIQIVRAMAALANHGVVTTPHFLLYRGTEAVAWDSSWRACTPESATAVAQMLQGVVDDGTASAAAIEGFAIGGKTGSAQKADLEHGGYLENEIYSSFVGFTGIPKGELLGYVGVDGGLLHGGQSAAPAFAEIMGEALRDLSITPNNGTTTANPWAENEGALSGASNGASSGETVRNALRDGSMDPSELPNFGAYADEWGYFDTSGNYVAYARM